MPQHYRPSNLDPIQLANLQYQSAMGVGGNQFREDFRKPGAFSNMAKSAAAGLLGAPADVAKLIASTANTGLLGAPQIPFTSQDLEQRFGADTSRPSGLLGMVGAPDPMDVARMAPKGLLAMTLFHGTPHKFDRFALDKIGTGEGAQAYGHGLYFAENPGVAGSYRDALSAGRGGADDDVIARALNAVNGDTKKAAAEMRGRADRLLKMDPEFVDGDPQEAASRFRAMADRIEQGFDPRGHLYEVDIPDEITDRMLDWDAPLSEQRQAVKDVFAPVIEARRAEMSARPNIYTRPVDDIVDNMNMGELYDELASQLGGQEAASRALQEAGIPGIRFLDGNSRAAGEGTRNIVVFNPDDIKSVKRDGELVWENRLGL